MCQCCHCAKAVKAPGVEWRTASIAAACQPHHVCHVCHVNTLSKGRRSQAAWCTQNALAGNIEQQKQFLTSMHLQVERSSEGCLPARTFCKELLASASKCNSFEHSFGQPLAPQLANCTWGKRALLARLAPTGIVNARLLPLPSAAQAKQVRLPGGEGNVYKM